MPYLCLDDEQMFLEADMDMSGNPECRECGAILVPVDVLENGTIQVPQGMEFTQSDNPGVNPLIDRINSNVRGGAGLPYADVRSAEQQDVTFFEGFSWNEASPEVSDDYAGYRRTFSDFGKEEPMSTAVTFEVNMDDTKYDFTPPYDADFKAEMIPAQPSDYRMASPAIPLPDDSEAIRFGASTSTYGSALMDGERAETREQRMLNFAPRYGNPEVLETFRKGQDSEFLLGADSGVLPEYVAMGRPPEPQPEDEDPEVETGEASDGEFEAQLPPDSVIAPDETEDEEDPDDVEEEFPEEGDEDVTEGGEESILLDEVQVTTDDVQVDVDVTRKTYPEGGYAGADEV